MKNWKKILLRAISWTQSSTYIEWNMKKKTQIGMVVFIYHLYLRNLGPWHILNWVGAKDGGSIFGKFQGGGGA